ncbi:hypothetical protein B0G80_1887 [Paraburkholderia sp. BL6669N2]|nr:hypothetical protein [Paraburkholderia sp. BL6669N2]REG59158.1 hypothetical protein B0G80_1887 [Paraburkholderia sp. BL6669N2]
MTELLKNHVARERIAGGGAGVTLTDPVTGVALVDRASTLA